VEKKPPLRAQYDKEPDNDQFSVKKHSMFEYYMSMKKNDFKGISIPKISNSEIRTKIRKTKKNIVVEPLVETEKESVE
jgi:hypothetical protein